MPRILHTMIRVGNLDRSIEFYTKVLGMRLLRREEYPEGKFTLAFVGYQDESEGAVIELTYNWGVDHYEMGNAFGHIAIAVLDAKAACDEIRARGGKVVRDAGPMKHGRHCRQNKHGRSPSLQDEGLFFGIGDVGCKEESV